MHDYWLTQCALGALGWGYLGLSIVALVLAAWIPRARSAKAVSFLIILGLVSVMPIRAYKSLLAERAAAMELKARYSKAKALFDERCKTAGEKIFRRVAGVSEILLVNPRPSGHHPADIADPRWINASFPTESTGEQHVMEFLYFYHPARGRHAADLSAVPGGKPGYRFVDLIEKESHVRYQLRPPSTYVSKADPVESYGIRETVRSPLPRYSVEYENIDDTEGRQSWIAGTRIKVTDRTNGELLGEFVRFSFEPGLGNTVGSRQPWAFAIPCPPVRYPGATGHIRAFVQQVLIPNGAEK